MFEYAAAKRIVRVPQPRYLLAIKGTPPVLQKTGWRGKPGSHSFWLLFIGDARKRSFVKAEFLRAQKIAISETLKSNQLPVCHRQR
jgi:hypothetical protein